MDHRDERLRRRAEQALGGFAGLPAWKRQVLARFLVETRRGWHTYLHPDDGGPDALLIGPMGVLAVALRDEEPDEVPELREAGRLFHDAKVRENNVSEAVVRPVVVLPAEHRPTARARDHLAVPASDLDRVLLRGERRLGKRDARALAEHLESRSTRYRPMTLPDESAAADEAELFDVAEVRQDRFDAALAGPFESWLTFLDDTQFGMVRRNYQGPARISGPAGTGKSVVALHRMVHLGKRTTGPLLFTTYARNLPPIMERQFRRLAPELAQRAEFRTLHSWALNLLRERGREFRVDHKQARSAFALAWARVGRSSRLSELDPHDDYWWEEVDRVIKGRGLAGLDEYQAVLRTGRARRLDRADRELMWRLFEEYERIRTERGLHDFNDLLGEALAEVRREPARYAAVVVDEVQDITLIGLRLLREVAGDGPNGLLLVGDGQQQIYPGGWRLSDAGIPVRGRGEVLRTNYRNASRVLDMARRFDATNQVDDLDGDVGVLLREAVATFRGGQALSWRGDRAGHEDALLAALRGLADVPRSAVAVLTFENGQAVHWRRVLREAGFEVMDLEDFDGEPVEKIKVGTVYRAKGLEFQAVLVPEPPKDADRGSEWHERGQRARLVAITRARDFVWVGFPAS
ncbi:UvrD-helicase domain-containing protein [Saccharopolyspora taberi]|uniref:UvrD-helicase domain-containing protein n=1 Tax=Saccharopolyspora taberi TaxID=60895 RepID=A0ABN3V4A0_9PSEU